MLLTNKPLNQAELYEADTLNAWLEPMTVLVPAVLEWAVTQSRTGVFDA